MKPALFAAVLAIAVVPSLAQAQGFDPAAESRNYSKTGERAVRDSDPAFQAQLRQESVLSYQEAVEILASDRERDFSGNLCWQHNDGCAGDVRLYHWGENGFGDVTPVLWTARNGATISGHLWSTKAGPAGRRPGVVITPGSVQAPEELYLFAATTLAKAGYVVLTFDVQGQGRSDTYGEAPDRNEGVPSQAAQPFYDGTEDALDFFLSTPSSPFKPRPSCTTGTDHAPKHTRRVTEGFNAAFNPLHGQLERDRIGLAGHSLGAAAVSFVGQKDPRVDAIVAWDNLRAPPIGVTACPSAAASREQPPITKPALGMSNDYALFAGPYTAAPDPAARNQASLAFSKAGVDSMQINLRGGTHFEYAYIPNSAFGATLRGIDAAAWYTQAWFDRVLRTDPSADARLLTRRWHDDAAGKAVDPDGDGNLLSAYLRSRYDLRRGAGRVVCEDLRAGTCQELVANDGRPANYSYLEQARTPDAAGTGTASKTTLKAPCRSRRVVTISLRLRRRERLRSVVVRTGGERPVTRRAARRVVRVSFKGRPKGTVRVRIAVTTRGGRRYAFTRAFRTCAPRR